MGNWRKVRIVGTFDPLDGKKIHEGIIEQSKWIANESVQSRRERFGPIGFGVNALRYGMNDTFGWFWRWEDGVIDETANLYERGFTPKDIARDLDDLVRVAPSLNVAVHCGAEYEREYCVATVTAKDGLVTIGPPAVAFVGDGIPESLSAVLLEPLRAWLANRSPDEREDWEE